MSDLAFFGGKPIVEDHAQLRGEWPLTDERDFEAIKRVYENNDFSGRGSKEVTALEDKFSHMHMGMHATALNSGTAAIHAALVALGIKPGDEVLVPNLTFVATAVAVLHALAIPIFVDIDSDDYNMSPNDIVRRISPRTKAVIVVHMHGYPAKMKQIRKLCNKYNLLLIEDVAQAPGATVDGQLVGTFGDASAFSLMSQKNLTTCGEAGVLLTKTLEQKNRAEMLRIYGEIIGEDGSRMYNSFSLGWNYTLNPMQAAMAATQLEKFPEITARIQAKGRLLNEELGRLAWVVPPLETADNCSVFHYYRIRLTPKGYPLEKIGSFRQAIQSILTAEGLNVRLYQNTPVSGQIIFREKKAYGRGLPWSLNPDVDYQYSNDQYPGTLDVLRSTLVLGAISSAPGYLLKEGTIEAYIEGFQKIDKYLPKVMEYALSINDYKEPWEAIPVTSDSFNAHYGINNLEVE